MRTISSLTWVGTLLPPWNSGCPLGFTALFAGKIPAFSNSVEFGSIMQLGIVLLGNGLPCVTVTPPTTGAVPPGQFLNRKAGVTLAALGTLIGMLEGSAPPYQAVLGTVCVRV